MDSKLINYIIKTNDGIRGFARGALVDKDGKQEDYSYFLHEPQMEDFDEDWKRERKALSPTA